MIKNRMRYVALNSMGYDLDNAGNYSAEQISIQPEAGFVTYDPSSGKIKTYVTLQNIALSDPSTREIYLNLATSRTYTFDGQQMNEVHMSAAEETDDQTPSDFSQPNTTYHICDVINSQTLTIGTGSTLEFHGNGCLQGCTLTGTDITIVPNGTQQIFIGCTFSEYKFVNSHLYATNFGAISDMHSVEEPNWSYRGLNLQSIKRRYGFSINGTFSGEINDAAWDMLVAFAKGSTNLKIEFNGNFMGNTPNTIDFKDCTDLELCGGTMLRGLGIIDCQNVHIHDMSFVGLHEAHDFPTILNDKAAKILQLEQQIQQATGAERAALEQKLTYWRDNTYYITYEGDNLNINIDGTPGVVPYGAMYSCGLFGDGIVVKRVEQDSSADFNVTIDHCHFEMRQNGVSFLSKFSNPSDIRLLSNCNINNCTFSHIFYQPVGSDAEHITFENIQAEYCLQGISFSTTANHCTVKNSQFRKCAMGPKQDTSESLYTMSHDNSFVNCLFEITNDYNIEETSRYIFAANKGASGDTLIVRNCDFVVNCTKKCDGMVFRSWRTVLDHVNIKIDINRPGETDYDILYLMGIGGATPHHPQVEMYHVDVECNCRLESMAFRGVSAVHAGRLTLMMQHFNLHGTGSISNIFEGEKNNKFWLFLDRCNFNLQATAFSRYVARIGMKYCDVRQISGTGFLPYDMGVDYTIEESNFVVGSRFLFINKTDGEIIVRRNTIRCSPLVSCKWDGSATIVLENNDITDLSPYSYKLFGDVSGTGGYDYWTDGGDNELVLKDNIIRRTGNLTYEKAAVYPAQYPDYAGMFYNNFFSPGFKQFNAGSSSERPTYPWHGMLHKEGGVLYEYDETTGWHIVS